MGEMDPTNTPPAGSQIDTAAITKPYQDQIDALKAKQEELLDDNKKYRDQRRELKSKIEELEKTAIPDGHVVMAQADADALKSYRELGKLEDLTSQVGELSTLKKEREITSVASVAQMNPTVLTTLLPSDAKLEVKEVTGEDGEKVKAAYITVGKDESSLQAYAQANWEAFLPALQTSAAEQPPAAPPPQSRTWVSQGSGNTPNRQLTADDIVETKKKAGAADYRI